MQNKCFYIFNMDDFFLIFIVWRRTEILIVSKFFSDMYAQEHSQDKL